MVSSREVIRKLEEDGWYKAGQTGDHVHFKHPSKAGKTTVPHPNRDLTIKTIRSIEKLTGVRLR